MSAAAIVLAALFAFGMLGVGIAVMVKGAQERSAARNSWPHWPPTKLG
jgi:hypothetical protein